MKAARLHHASLPERIGYLEKNIWDSADKHNKETTGDNADKHARELAAHGDAHSIANKVAEKKIAENFLITTIKGIGCSWMV